MVTRSPGAGKDLRSRFVTVHGYRRAYLRAGRGPALLLIHGIGDNSGTWRDLIPELARSHTVIAPDLLGHGLSDKPRGDYSVAGYACGMRDLLTVLGIERVTVVGHSLGGGVAMQFAYQFPARCERLVLVSAGGVGPDLHPLLRAATVPGSGHVLSLLASAPVRGVSPMVVGALRLLHTDVGRDADDLMRVFASLQASTARQAFLRTLRSAVDGRGQAITMLDRCYLAAGMPSLIVWGEHDGVIPVEHARIAHVAMPGSRLEIFPDAGHYPHHSDPVRFQAVLEDFLATTRPASHSDRQWRALLRSHGAGGERGEGERGGGERDEGKRGGGERDEGKRAEDRRGEGGGRGEGVGRRGAGRSQPLAPPPGVPTAPAGGGTAVGGG
ncbi:Pimeloyl-ACP methyl ester carboxylesterase [Parafrankia irregularis]|uniref:Pimeloyl-ACP methyl ester carboxylesterase n=1 Tax=Parafrankia irregularis TaxID=795642 RepID=A0A0S4QWK0_9ACTN|nr:MULTISPECIES: alpha/beta fold hydrolase [Parafrankia]MBE3205205.1 alpha/beta fold hydrolase [Parafrankia sp. CH37]CUU58838.1 Pimeloyl-ACP methyl ester carboxylesterase [Parafrankia irregularis]